MQPGLLLACLMKMQVPSSVHPSLPLPISHMQLKNHVKMQKKMAATACRGGSWQLSKYPEEKDRQALPLPLRSTPEGHHQLCTPQETSAALLSGRQQLSKQRRTQTPTKGPVKTIHLFWANRTHCSFICSMLDQPWGGASPLD